MEKIEQEIMLCKERTETFDRDKTRIEELKKRLKRTNEIKILQEKDNSHIKEDDYFSIKYINNEQHTLYGERID